MAERILSKTDLENPEIIKREVDNWLKSDIRIEMEIGLKYYRGDHDILHRGKIGFTRNAGSKSECDVYDVDRTNSEHGGAAGVDNLPDNRLINNRYAELVDQKTNYLLGKPPIYAAENDEYAKAIRGVLNFGFNRTLRNIGMDALNCHIGWLYVYTDETFGSLKFRRISPLEIIPYWTDDEETELKAAIRVYSVEISNENGTGTKTERRVEVYLPDKVNCYIYDKNMQEVSREVFYLESDEDDGTIAGYGWGKIPLIGFRYNSSKIPLIRRVKGLQDALNEIMSFFMNNMQEDARSTIFILKNYGGTDGAEFKKQLMNCGVINVIDVGDGSGGGVEVLQVDVNADNYDLLISTLKKAITENGRGYDSKDANSGATSPNEMNLKSMYVDIDLDANMMETEFQASFEDLFYFVNVFFKETNKPNFENERIEVIFNRDTIVDESSIVSMITSLTGIVSRRTQVEQLPFVTNADDEMERIEEEEQKRRDENELYQSFFAIQELDSESVVDD